MLEPDAEAMLVKAFAQAVVRVAGLSRDRLADIEHAVEFSTADGEIRCICGITGSTYSAAWNAGGADAALAFAEESGEASGWLIANTPHYRWLYGRRRSRDHAPDGGSDDEMRSLGDS